MRPAGVGALARRIAGLRAGRTLGALRPFRRITYDPWLAGPSLDSAHPVIEQLSSNNTVVPRTQIPRRKRKLALRTRRGQTLPLAVTVLNVGLRPRLGRLKAAAQRLFPHGPTPMIPQHAAPHVGRSQPPLTLRQAQLLGQANSLKLACRAFRNFLQKDDA